MVGDGGFGAVYVGTLRDGQRVAIKKLFYANHRRMDQFYNEIHILSQLSHPNLVKLYGFCCQDERDLLLVFEYVPKGSLFDCLHDSSLQQQQQQQHPDGMKCWRIRLRIAWEIAEALQYLHNFASPPIFHRDVKTSNILLDDDFHAKLADFGISRFVPERAPHITTVPQGTPGYVDPEYHTCHRLTDKSDVFSFGVVLMELLSGRQAVDMFASSPENVNLFALTLRKVTDGTWHQLLDHSCWSSNHHCDLSVSGQQFEALHLRKLSSSDGETLGCSPLIQSDTSDYYENDVVKHLIELAFRCLQPASVDRPSMTYVAETLSNLCRGCGIVTSLHKPSTVVDQISGAAVMPPFRHNPSSSCSADSTISSKCGSSCSKSTTNSSLPPSPMYIDVNDTTHLIFKPEITF
jgi:serine/threonine protein kinase